MESLEFNLRMLAFWQEEKRILLKIYKRNLITDSQTAEGLEQADAQIRHHLKMVGTQGWRPLVHHAKTRKMVLEMVEHEEKTQ